MQSLNGDLATLARRRREHQRTLFLGAHTVISQRAELERSGVIGLGIDIPRALRELDTYLRRHPPNKRSAVPLRRRRSRR